MSSVPPVQNQTSQNTQNQTIFGFLSDLSLDFLFDKFTITPQSQPKPLKASHILPNSPAKKHEDKMEKLEI